MKKASLLLLPLLLASACTIHIGPTKHEQPNDERILQLIANVPDHGLQNATRDEFTPEYYDLLTQAWAIPSDAIDGIGSEEWLYYFVSGNGEPAVRTVLGDVKVSNDTVIADMNMLFEIGPAEEDSLFHYITLVHNGEKWVISDFDDTKYQLGQYIKSQREHFKSREWQDYLDYASTEYDNAEADVEAKKKEVEHYFRQYPDAQ